MMSTNNHPQFRSIQQPGMIISPVNGTTTTTTTNTNMIPQHQTPNGGSNTSTTTTTTNINGQPPQSSNNPTSSTTNQPTSTTTTTNQICLSTPIKNAKDEPTLKQKELLELYDMLLAQIGHVRAGLDDMGRAIVGDVMGPTLQAPDTPTPSLNPTIDREKKKNELVKALGSIQRALAAMDIISPKLTPYSSLMQSSSSQVLENTWGANKGLFESQNIKIQTVIRSENYWREETAKRSSIALKILDKKLKDKYPNLNNEPLQKKRKDPFSSSPQLPISSSSSLSLSLSNNINQSLQASTSITNNNNLNKPLIFDTYASVDGIIESMKMYPLEINKIPSHFQIKGLFIIFSDVFKCLVSFNVAEESRECFKLDRIAFFGVKEGFDSFWGSSKHNIFKKLSENAYEAISYYTTHHNNQSILKNILLWIYSFRGLFVEECKGCGNILQLDSSSYMYLPPSFRTCEGSYTPYHPICFQTSSTSSHHTS